MEHIPKQLEEQVQESVSSTETQKTSVEEVEEFKPKVREGYKLLLDDNFDILIAEVNKRVRVWHDKKVEYVFLNETSATQYGYLFEESWKSAYPGEPLPKFYRIDPRALGYHRSSTKRISGDVLDSPIYQDGLKRFLQDRIKDKNAEVVIFDEWSLEGRAIAYVREALVEYGGVLENNIITDHGSISLPGCYGANFPGLPPTKGISNLTKREQRGRNLDTLTEGEIKFTGQVNRKITQSYGDLYDEGGRRWSKDLGESKKWSRFDTGSNRMVRGILPKEYFEKVTYSDGSGGELAQKTFSSLDYINDLKKAGKEAGEKLRTELQENANQSITS